VEHLVAGELSWEPAGEANFTGRVWFGPMSQPPDPTGLLVLGVQFSPGARTDWHRHPGGQVLYVVAGAGRVVNESGGRVAMAPGDVVTIPPGEVHWHGAAADAPMVHLSLTTGGPTEWLGEKVHDADYADPQ
jgi:quercetin dioxygenase-like cupin family protein